MTSDSPITSRDLRHLAPCLDMHRQLSRQHMQEQAVERAREERVSTESKVAVGNKKVIGHLHYCSGLRLV